MEYKFTLEFNLTVETGNKDLEEIKKMVAKAYSEYCGEPVKIIKEEEIKNDRM